MSSLIPSGWALSKINDTCDVFDSQRIPLNTQERALRKGHYPYYGANGVQGFIDDFIFDGEYVLLAEDGGYFEEFSSRPISYLVSGKFWVNNHAHILQAKKGHETKYIHYSLVHKNILKHINGGTRSKLNQSDMRDIEYLAPPLPEQQKIATILSSVDDVIEKTRAQIDKLKDLKTGMMQELLTKGTGHTEFKDSPVGRIPAAWEVTHLGSVVMPKGIQTGPFGSQLHAHEYVDWGVPVVMPRDMKGNKIDPALVSHIPLERAVELDRHRVEINDFLFARRGDIGRFALVDKSNEGWVCGTGCLKVRMQPSVNPIFMASYLTLKPVIEWLNLNAVGQTMLNLNTSILSELPIVLPSEKEQTMIGETIASLDNKVALSSAKLDSLQIVKKALMQDLLTGKVRVI